MNIEKEREAFIDWATSKNLNVDHETLCNGSTKFYAEKTQLAWEAWLEQAKKTEGCVVVPKDQIEVWWQDSEEPENFATTIESIPALGENLADKEIMEIDEHHAIYLPSKRIYGTWFEKDGERSFVTGSLEECRALVEAARGGNE